MKMRYYQDEAIDIGIFDYFKTHPDPSNHPVIAMPTGTGKAVVIGGFVTRVLQQWPNQRILMLVHTKELVHQNADKVHQIWPQAPLGIVSAGLGLRQYGFPLTFGSVLTVANAIDDLGRFDIVLIDEAHMVSPNEEATYAKLLTKIRQKNPYVRFIGLSATPYRLGLGMITDGGIFTDVSYDITSMGAFTRLLDEQYLAPLVPMQTQVVLDVTNVHKRGGEFIPKELQAAVTKYDLTRDALSEAAMAAQDRNHWLVFTSGIEHAMMVEQILTEFGISAACIHSKMSNGERDRRLEAFKTGLIRCLINADILTTGFDFPALDCIILLRPTNSPVLHVQILGRGTRPFFHPSFSWQDLESLDGRLAAIAASPKQNCLVLDFAGNTRRLGPINDPRIPNRKKEGNGDIPIKTCASCGCLNHISARICANPDCGAEFTFEEKITAQASTIALIVRDEPIVEVFNVDRVTAERHTKAGAIPSLKVSYFCGVRRFTEYICLEHVGSPIQRKAQHWWTERHPIKDNPTPLTIDDALLQAPSLNTPQQIRVWVNQKYPKILSYVFEKETAS